MDVIAAVARDQRLWDALILTVIAMLADLASGVLGAWRTHTFSVAFLDAFISSHLAGRVFPLVLAAIVVSALSAAVSGSTDQTIAAGGGAGWLAVAAGVTGYVLTTLGSVLANVQQAPAPPPSEGA